MRASAVTSTHDATHAATHDATRALTPAMIAALAATLVLTLVVPAALPAQRAAATVRPTPLLRADLLADRGTTLQVGAGLVLPAGYQARVALEGGVGATLRDGRWRPSARVDAIARFLFDPFREARWGLSAGGGAGLRWEADARPRPVALVTLGLQGAATGRTWLRGVELGLGDGVRVGATLARPRPGRR